MYKRIIKIALFTLVWEGGMIALFVVSGSLILIPFCIIGLYLPYMLYKEISRVFSVKKYGIYHVGIITDHVEDQTMSVNNNWLLALQVRYYGKNGEPKEVVIPTGDINTIKYPVGSCIRFIENEKTKECLYVARADKFPNAEALMDIDVEFSNNEGVRKKLMSCTCPNCGATLMVSDYGVHKCNFCGQSVSLNDVELTNGVDKTTQGVKHEE